MREAGGLARRIGAVKQWAIEELELPAPEARDREKPRERLLGAAYELFAAKGVGHSGDDARSSDHATGVC